MRLLKDYVGKRLIDPATLTIWQVSRQENGLLHLCTTGVEYSDLHDMNCIDNRIVVLEEHSDEML